MIRLQSSASMGALALALIATPALADTTISSDSSTPLVTSSAGDIKIDDGDTLTVTSGTAITVDSNNDLNIVGDIKSGAADGQIAIQQNAGTTSSIYVDDDSTITLEEDYSPSTTNNTTYKYDSTTGTRYITTGAAEAENRYGLYVAGDAAGSIDMEGTLTVEGNNSAAIYLNGTYTGDVKTDGSISVVGDNSYGLYTNAVDGNVTIEGAVSAVGYESQAIDINGAVSGTFLIQGAVTKGYTFTDDDGDTITLSDAALNTGTAAVQVSGSVAGGIYLAAPPDDSSDACDGDTDCDNDGTKDSEEGTGSITNYGSGAALLVGGTSDITIGDVSNAYLTTQTGENFSVVVEGSITSSNTSDAGNTVALEIGGQGGAVTLTDGIGVSGTISATSYADATAILINADSTVTKLYNSGTIEASLTSSSTGTATAIKDLSNSLTTIENTGYITADANVQYTATAIDLSTSTQDVTITQYINQDDLDSRADYADDHKNDASDVDTTVYEQIKGDILLGSGNDTIDISSGQIIGNIDYGSGTATLALSDDAYVDGNVTFGGAATVTLAGTSTYIGTMDFDDFTGTVTIGDSATLQGNFENAANVTVNVNGGSLLPSTVGVTDIGTVNVTSSGTLGVYVTADGSSTINAGTATLAEGTSIKAVVGDLLDLSSSDTTGIKYTVLTSDNLTAGTVVASADTNFIYKGTVSQDADDVYLTVTRKSADELGLNRTQGQAWDAIYSTAGNSDKIAESFLDVTDSKHLKDQITDLMPDHAGGVFHSVTMADRLAATHISDDTSLFNISKVGGWLEPIYYRAHKDATGTSQYNISGWGISLGLEKHYSFGYLGFNYAYLGSTVDNDYGSGKLKLSQQDFGVFYRNLKGPLLTYARIGGSYVSVDSKRTYTGTIDDDDTDTVVNNDFSYTSDGKWHGWLVSALAGASYKFNMSRRFSLKPKVELEEMWLTESGYKETSDDNQAMPLTVSSRTSSSLSVTPTVTASYSLGTISPDWRPLTFQVEGGMRQPISGHLGDTTAYFNGGDTFDKGSKFTLTPDSYKSTWIGEVSMLAGGYDFTWKISARGEYTSTSLDLSARASISIAF